MSTNTKTKPPSKGGKLLADAKKQTKGKDDIAKAKLPLKATPSGVKAKSTVPGSKVSGKSSKETITPAGKQLVKQSSIENPKDPMRKPIKIELKTSSKSSSKPVPLKAKQMVVISKNNVMNQVHNVTVASPPSQRKAAEVGHLPRDRTRTRTLDPDEIIVLKKPQEKIPTQSIEPSSGESSLIEPVKPPIAFEVNFPEEKKPKEEKKDSPDQEYAYEDDFESYESDFESENSSKQESSSEDEKSESAEESTPASSPEIPQHSKDEEKKLDSGNYELQVQREKSPLDNIEEQIDSGVTFGEDIVPRLTIMKKTPKNSRGQELMKKISLDAMTFALFELKPIPYEYYMKVYGQSNTTQISTQTQSNEIDQDTQTDENVNENAWTQFPPTFSKEIFKSSIGSAYHEERIGVGRDSENTLQPFNHLNQISSQHIDYESLNQFLKRAAVSVASVIQKKIERKIVKSSSIPGSLGYLNISLDHEAFEDYEVVKLFTDREIPNLLVTVHQLKEVTEGFAYKNLIGIWSVNNIKYPVRILTSWSDVSCVLIHKSSAEVVISAFIDGSLAIWDSRESFHWNKEGDKMLGQAPSQLVVPKISENLPEIGRIVKLKSLDCRSEYNFFVDFSPVQICSLHEEGILIIWSLLHSSTKDPTISTSHTFSAIQLIQNNLFDLRPHLMDEKSSKNHFERKLSYFESDLFNDSALKELQDRDSIEEKTEILCTDFVSSPEGYFVATNRPFLLFFNKSPKRGSVVRITLEEVDCKNYATVLELCPIMENHLVIGYSDGSVRMKPIVMEAEEASGISIDEGKASEENEESNLSAKSCAIQNIVKNERKLYEDSQALNNLDSSEVTKSYTSRLNEHPEGISSISGKILGGSYFRKEFVRRIQMTKHTIFALCGNSLKGFHLKDRQEIPINVKNLNIIDIGTTTDELSKARLVIAARGEIQIHNLDTNC
ncbi:hypothetical protein DMENIID0001_130160 [Sergentomyia squamirostris]